MCFSDDFVDCSRIGVGKDALFLTKESNGIR